MLLLYYKTYATITLLSNKTNKKGNNKMSDSKSDSMVAEFEDTLRQVTVATWNRVRSSDELRDFIDRRHSALADIEL